MATALCSLVQQLDITMDAAPALHRASVLRNLATLFADYAPRLGTDHVHAFDLVMLHLARTMDEAARSDLSRRIASIANAPPGLIRDLASDSTVSVASPVLERAACLGDDDLSAIARICGQAQLMAITRRDHLVEPVTDIVIERGDGDVSRSVARNPGARFSIDGYARLLGRSLSDPDLAASLDGRGDMPAILRLGRSPQTGVDPSDSGAASPDAAIFAAEVFAAEVFVGGQSRRGEITEALVVSWLDSGRQTEALVALARLAGVPSHMAIEAYQATSYEPLLYLVRSIRFGWKILTLFMASKSAREAPPDVLQGMKEAFQALSVTTAQRVVRMTAARSRISAAQD